MNFRPGRRRREPRVGVVSLIDVILQLVIFLLLTTTFKSGEASLDVDVPGAESATPISPGSITVEIDRNGTLFLEGNVVGREDLGNFFRQEARTLGSRRVTIRADRQTFHGNVVDVMDLARSSEVKSLAIAARPADSPLAD